MPTPKLDLDGKNCDLLIYLTKKCEGLAAGILELEGCINAQAALWKKHHPEEFPAPQEAAAAAPAADANGRKTPATRSRTRTPRTRR